MFELGSAVQAGIAKRMGRVRNGLLKGGKVIAAERKGHGKGPMTFSTCQGRTRNTLQRLGFNFVPVSEGCHLGLPSVTRPGY